MAPQQAQQSYDGWIGRDAYDQSGEKIGEITDIYYDDRTQRPEWVGVKTGKFGAKTTFVPIHGSQIRTTTDDDDEDTLQLAFDQDMIKGAPKIDPEGHMSPAEEQELWAYYGYDYNADTTARNTDYGYGEKYQTRADKDYKLNEQTETVPVKTTATVEVPVEANVRLRRYQTQNQRTETRTVEVPVTETEEHTEVVGVDAKTTTTNPGGTGTNTIRNQPRP